VFIGRVAVALPAAYRMFLLINVLWVAETAVVGYLGGKRSKAAEHQLSLISLGLLAAIIAVLRRPPRP